MKVLAIDLGTSQIKIMILNSAMEIEYVGSCRYTTISEKRGYLEQDPQEWRKALRHTLENLKILQDVMGKTKGFLERK